METKPARTRVGGRVLLVALLCATSRWALASSLEFTFERFTIPGDGQIAGNGINNAGDVAGFVDDFATGSLRRLGFVRLGTAITLIDFPGTDDLNGTVANGLDDAGRVVGRFTEAPLGSRTHGFVIQGEQRELFDVPGASTFTEASDINNRGVIVGRTFLDSDLGIGSAFVRIGEKYSFFRPEDARGPFGCAFYGVNDQGDTVGEVLNAAGFQSFAILDGRYMPFTIPGSYRTVAHGINNAGQVVGWYYAPDASSIHGFLMDYTGLYRIDAPAAGSYGTFIGGINDAGSVVGSVGFHRFPAQEVVLGSPCDVDGDDCVAAPRIGDPLIDFTQTVGFDVRPGSATNPVNPSAGGVLPVALLGSDAFVVADIDPVTLAFGPLGAASQHSHADDVNGDGFIDLVLHFRVEESGIVAGDTQACIAGALLGGRPFRGCDAIRTVPGSRLLKRGLFAP
jgi:uncharacterized membrane protein